jgi:hypothetical protein
MTTRLRKPTSVVLDGRALADLVAPAWTPAGPVPTVFEFAFVCGAAGTLVDAAERRHAVRIVAVLYMGGRIFAAPGDGPARFGVLLRARRRAEPGIYDLDIAENGLPYMRDIPVAALPPARAREFGGNLLFLVG